MVEPLVIAWHFGEIESAVCILCRFIEQFGQGWAFAHVRADQGARGLCRSFWQDQDGSGAHHVPWMRDKVRRKPLRQDVCDKPDG